MCAFWVQKQRLTVCNNITPTILGNDEHLWPFCVVLKIEGNVIGLSERIQVTQGYPVEILRLKASEADGHGDFVSFLAASRVL